jgi:MFS superfamily sulfate permease-like transporter
MTRPIPQDVLAGLVLAAIAIPEQLATARLAGMPPSAALYAFIAGAIGFAIFGTNRFLSAGADSTIASIFASGLATLAAVATPAYVELASMLAIMVGVVLVAAALLRAGWVADLLSIPVTTGFLAGIALHIIIGQLPSVLGVPDGQGDLLAQLDALRHHLPHANLLAVAIGVFVFAVTQLVERVMPRLPGALLAIATVMLATALLHFQARGIDTLGVLPASPPHLMLPFGQLHDVPHLLPLALIVALVCMMQTAAVLRAFPSQPGGPQHVAHDYGGVGAGNIIAGLLGTFPVNASPPRTAVVVEAGGQSQFAALTAVAVTAALLLGGGWLLDYLPHSALGGLLVAIGVRLFRLDEMLRILRCGGYEILLVILSAALVILLPIETGMLCAIVLSLLHSFYALARPLCSELARAPGSTVWWPPHGEKQAEYVPGVLVFAPSAPLNFTNANFIRRQLLQAIAAAHTPVGLVIIEASGVTDIDYTAAMVLQQTIALLHERGIDLALARLLAERAQEQARRTGLLDAFGAARVFHSVEQAVLANRPASA